MSTLEFDASAVMQFIEDLDLVPARSCALAANPGWTPNEADEALRRYRDFLFVCWTCDQQGGQRLAEVDRRVDAIWHCHTKQASYTSDCATIFGDGRVLKHEVIVPGQAVASAINVARLAYAAAGRPFPTDYERANCVWSVIEVAVERRGEIENLTPDHTTGARDEYEPDRSRRAFAAQIVDVLNSVTTGRFAFNPPTRMHQGQTERITVAVVRSQSLDKELLAALRGSGIPELASIRTSPLMTVQLRGHEAFDITALSESEQAVNTDAITGWEFDVCALRSGTQVLTAAVALRLPVEGHDDVRSSLPVMERSVHIQVAPMYLTRRFLRNNWQWVVGTLVSQV